LLGWLRGREVTEKRWLLEGGRGEETEEKWWRRCGGGEVAEVG
jgi:hypothetical protein